MLFPTCYFLVLSGSNAVFGRGFGGAALERRRDGAEKWIQGLYAAGQIREINVHAKAAASLQFHKPCRLHVERLKRYPTLLKFKAKQGKAGFTSRTHFLTH